MESLSSFIGVDGTNTTLNSGRMLINLKPRDERDAQRDARSSAACSRSCAQVAGHHALHAAGAGPDDRGPRQPHAVPVHARGAGRRRRSAHGCRGWSSACSSCRSSPTSPATCRTSGLQAYVDIDRDTAGRLGITPAAIDNALYNAFGQRLISTIFTQTNQYRVVLEVKPEFQRGPAALDDIYVHGAAAAAQQVPLSTHRAASIERAGAAGDQPHRPVPGGDDLVQPRARRVARATRSTAIEAAERELGMPRERADQLPGRGARVPAPRSPTTLLLILAAIVTMYIVLGVLYESYIHPITILSTLPSAGVGALLALMLSRQRPRHHRDHRHHPADRHRQEERDHDDRLRARRRARARARRRARRSTRRACCASGRS